MPLPKPKKGENSKDFLSRCMGNPTMNDEYPDQKQRYAVCNSLMEKKSKASLIFLNEKLYDQVSKDANTIFGEEDSYAKKIWIVHEYKQEGGEVSLVEDTSKDVLAAKASDHNKRYDRKVSKEELEEVYNRGLNANKGNVVFAMARVNAFLIGIRNGEYSQDQDVARSVGSFEVKDGEFVISSKIGSTQRSRSLSVAVSKTRDETIVKLLAHVDLIDDFDYFKPQEINFTGNDTVDFFLHCIKQSGFDSQVVAKVLLHDAFVTVVHLIEDDGVLIENKANWDDRKRVEHNKLVLASLGFEDSDKVIQEASDALQSKPFNQWDLSDLSKSKVLREYIDWIK